MKRVLLDHCIPKRLRRWLTGGGVKTADQEGWSELENGRLVAAAEEARFAVFITSDKNLSDQQNLAVRRTPT